MKLATYLEEKHKSATVLAADCGVSVSTITRLAAGERRPSMELAEKIAMHTGNRVQPNDFAAAVAA